MLSPGNDRHPASSRDSMCNGSDSHLSISELPNMETSTATADLEDQIFTETEKTSVDMDLETKPAVASAPPTKVVFLDGFRGLAAILVVLQHSHERPTAGLHLGSVAVDIFFVLSSFLLTWLFMKKSMKMLAQKATFRAWTFAVLDYFQKRFFRVYPLFVVTAIAISLLSFEDKHRYYRLNDPKDFVLYKVLLFYPQFRPHVFWSLPLEIEYYFVIPLFVAVSLRLRRFWWAGAAPLVVWIVYEGFVSQRASHMPLGPHLHTFMAGSLGAVVFVKLDLWIKKTKFGFRWWHTLLLRVVEGIAIALMLSAALQGLFFDWLHLGPPLTNPVFPYVNVQLTVIFVIEMIHPSCVSTMFEWSVLRYWGKISFSAYLLHSFILDQPFISQQQKYFNRFFARFGIILLLSTASYHLIEYPSQLLAQRISRFLAAREGHGSGDGLVKFTSMKRVNMRKQKAPTEAK